MRIKWLDGVASSLGWVTKNALKSMEYRHRSMEDALAAARSDIRVMLSAVERQELEKIALRRVIADCDQAMAMLHRERSATAEREDEAIEGYKRDADNYKAAYLAAIDHINGMKAPVDTLLQPETPS